MFSQALNLVSRSLAAAPRPARNGHSDDDDDSDSPFVRESGRTLNTLDPNSATTRALALPEILERVGRCLDRPSLLNSLLVSHHFYDSLLPVLWYSIQLRIAHPDFPKILGRLEKNLCRVRNLTIEDITTGDRRGAVDDNDESDGEGDRNDENGGVGFRGHLRIMEALEIMTRNDLSLLQYLTLDCGFPSTSTSTTTHILNKCLGKFSGLKHLDVGSLGNTQDRHYIQRILDAHPSLESLRVVWSTQSPLLIEDQGLQQPRDLTNPSRQLALQRLCLVGLQWLEQDFLQLVQQCPRLEGLTILGPSKAPWDWTVSTIDRFAEFCPHVARIHIDPGYGSCFEDSLLARLLETFPSLRSFLVPRCDFGPETFKALKSRIGQMEELNVALTRKPGVDSRMLVQLMTRASNLRYLDASGVSLDPWLFQVIPDTDQQPRQQQQQIEQDNEENTPDWMRSRPQPLSPDKSWACHRLEAITIGFATLHANQRQCQAIYANLSHLHHLRRIHILPNHFPISFEAGIEQLASLRQLTHFDVHGIERVISEEVIKWMGRIWPRLQVLRVYLDGKEKRTLVKSWLQQVGREDVKVEAD
ncbi:hypothetical protein BGX29_004045 [Mortierella sp. GBA35]|nr:hypothetical protein BGX29_004045 [Mortierella sp. GBA35]